MYTKINRLASAIKNHVDSGLQGFHTSNSLSLELIEDEIINERLSLLKQYGLKGVLPTSDLYTEINCIPVDCLNIEKCTCTVEGTPTAHFEIPQILTDVHDVSILYLGSTDKQNPFIYYTSVQSLKTNKYRKRGKNKPLVWIDTTPNKNDMFDCFVFNAPLLKEVSLIAILKDPRLISKYPCCSVNLDTALSAIDSEIVTKLSLRYLYFYRQAAMPPKPNDQTLTQG